MLKKDLLKKIETAKDEDDINELLRGTDIETAFKGEEPTLDVFKGKIAAGDKDFKAFMDAENDKHHAKAIKTMKEKGTWESEFSNELKTKFPDLVTDPVQIELAKERKAREELEAKLAKKDLLAKAVKYADEKGVKLSSIDKYLGDDLESTKTNIDGLADDWSKALEAAVDTKLKGSSYTPGGGSGDSKISVGTSFAQKANAQQSTGNDPWASATGNANTK